MTQFGDALEELADLRRALEESLLDENCEPLLDSLAMKLDRIANAITPANTSPGPDANGGFVASLTEAVMGCSSGLAAIANAINRLADVVEATGEQ